MAKKAVIKDAGKKITKLKSILNNKINTFQYKFGPSLYFYQQTIANRKDAKNVEAFLSCEKNIEYMYATLVSWNMDSRGARMEDFNNFKTSITVKNIDLFKEIEKNIIHIKDFDKYAIKEVEIDSIMEATKEIYQNLKLMKSNGKLVSNSKLLHFIFPGLFMPMDKKNTLPFFFENSQGESLDKFMEMFIFSHSLAQEEIPWKDIIKGGNVWHTSIPKIIDNAIIMNGEK